MKLDSFIRCAVVFFPGTLAVGAVAAPIDDLLEFIESERQRLEIPGVSAALIDGGTVRYMSLGVRRNGESDSVSSTDAFNIGSITKTIAAWAVMKLVEQGRVSLDSPVEQYIDNHWQLPDTGFDAAAVTLRRILTHTAGLSAPSYQGFPSGSVPVSLEDSLSGIPVSSSAVRIVVEPGSEFRYSGGGFALAQLVVESVTGRPYSEFVTEEIFVPLGMAHAEYLTFDREPLPVSPHDYGGRPITDYRMIEQGAGGLRASAEDLVSFLMANMTPNPVLANGTINAMHEPLTIIDEDSTQTLGFEHSGNLLSHGGHSRGWVAHIDFAPVSLNGLVILTNSANGIHFIQPVRCKWSELFGIDNLAARCDQLIGRSRITHWMLVFASVAAWTLAVWTAWRGYADFRKGMARLSLAPARIAIGLACALAIATLWAVLGTGLGVYLASGVRWGLPTIHYFQPAALCAAVSLTVLLCVILCAIFLRRQVY